MANYPSVEEKILKLNNISSERIKDTEDMRKRNDKTMTENADIESNLIRFRWTNEKYLNKLGNSSGQVASFHIKLKGLNNENHQMQQ